MYPCRFCGDISYRSIGTTAYCWSHYWREWIPRRRSRSLRVLNIPDNDQVIGHFVFVEWQDQITREACVECSLCHARTVRDPFHALGLLCSFCVERYGAARRLVLLPPPITSDIVSMLEEWSSALREAVKAGDVTSEEASRVWGEWEHEHE